MLDKIQIKDKKDQAFVNTIINALDDKKGSDITFIDLTKINEAVCDYFIVSHASSKTQVNALADWVIDQVREVLDIKPIHSEGFQNAEWILLDFGYIIVHIFEQEKRYFYKLEDLWADAAIINLNENE